VPPFAFLAFLAFTHCCGPIGRSVDDLQSHSIFLDRSIIKRFGFRVMFRGHDLVDIRRLSPPRKFANPANGLDELAARDATIDVICGSGNEKARMSRHEISPMRGRDTSILQPQASDATM
jgi:hypothetical protein